MSKRSILIIGALVILAVVIISGIHDGIQISAAKNNAAYVGDSKCLMKCHAMEVAKSKGKSNKHNIAYESLVNYPQYKTYKEKGKEGECLVCHVTGYGKPGGFKDEKSTPDLAKVGCEACHGPGSEHVAADPEDIKEKKATIILRPDCVQCHKFHKHF